MKYMFGSDIHGSAVYCAQLLEAFEHEEADRLILLGDLLYHGPRNDLPEGYDPKKVTTLLNLYKDKIIGVRGNCDADIDQVVLEFPMMADYCFLPVEDKTIFITHGHCYNELILPPLKKGDILMNGHTHVNGIKDHGDYLYINPGSVSMPKGGTQRSYLTLEDGSFALHTLEGEIFETYHI